MPDSAKSSAERRRSNERRSPDPALACRPLALGPPTAHTKAGRSTAPDQPAEPGPTAGPDHRADTRGRTKSTRPDDPCPLMALTPEAKASQRFRFGLQEFRVSVWSAPGQH